VADTGFKDRMFDAQLYASGQERRRVTQAEVAEAAAKLLKRKGWTAAAVSRHFGGRVPDVRTIAAYAKVMGVDPGWLAFGDASEAPAPDVTAARLAQRVERPGKQKKA
jgi:alkylation response protein AidB-like acyl-CoA dehydrogenase